MSRRRDRRRQESAERKPGSAARSGGEEAEGTRGQTRSGPPVGAAGGARPDRAHGLGLPVQLGLLAAVFGIAVGVAELAGAANLGVSFGIGQVVFTVVLIWLLIRA
jgi:hypothetical protein